MGCPIAWKSFAIPSLQASRSMKRIAAGHLSPKLREFFCCETSVLFDSLPPNSGAKSLLPWIGGEANNQTTEVKREGSKKSSWTFIQNVPKEQRRCHAMKRSSKGCFWRVRFLLCPLRFALKTPESPKVNWENVAVHVRVLDDRFSARRLLRSLSAPHFP